MNEPKTDWWGFVRAWWPASELVMIKNERMGLEERVSYTRIEGKFFNGASGWVRYHADGSVRFVVDK